jgi:flavin-dependent dehydrogenase
LLGIGFSQVVIMDQVYTETDVVVVGGGPAGLAAAIATRRKGLRVVVAERAQAPIDKVCGEGLMPDGVAALARLGVTIPLDRSVPFRGIRFIAGETSTDASFPNGFGMGIRRTTLHEVLVKNACDAGVVVSWGSIAKGLTPDGVDLGSHIIRCRWVIGADGQNSMVRKWSGLHDLRFEQIRFAHRRHFEVTPWTDFVEVYWGDNFQVVITPVGPRLICAALVSRNPRLRLDHALAAIPRLSQRLNGAAATTKEKGAVSVLRGVRAVSRERVALVGDASGSVESLTGEGLCLAFKQVIALAEAIANCDLSQYAAAHRRIARLPNLMSRLLLAMDRHTLLRARVLRAFEARPQTFSRLLETHLGGGSPATLHIGTLLGLGWQVLTGLA